MKVLDGKYFRPVLHLSKQQIEDYLTRRGLAWRVDSSNELTVYKRNKVRLDLLPLMEQLAGGKPALVTRFAQLAQQSEDLKEWIDSEVGIVLVFSPCDCFHTNQRSSRLRFLFTVP